ncbi:TRAP transporter permease [Alkalilimnicola ehrlichii MLHE-1]|uniref:TRAP transporter, 4TM/12TM fusion protein n=1 Tax=Alkalilimnicola ehrlichii (strain ATCC BAA-1101 / DSM 17681 / MLHE-1) TaxID=187272 RepID=Q0A6X2_ALKEH|nr:TRAP transporter permease [Alkalilimnicola ehrlichii]ABI57415.1 TRAP transporter, 4TM/12TM fusion protein [Alkalilimnicola ehrlichii MLHE-1]
MSTPRNGEDQAREMARAVESGARQPRGRLAVAAIALLCLAWSAFQVAIAWDPIDAHIARVWHLAFAITLAYLLFPARHRPAPRWLRPLQRFGLFRDNRQRIPWVDILLALVAAAATLWIWWDYEEILWRAGLPEPQDIVLGIVLVVLLLEAARRTLGWALPILAALFLIYCFAGPWMPGLLRHRGVSLEILVNDMYLSDSGIFGVPLGVSVGFVFLFVLLGALLERAGAGKYFIDVAYSALGSLRGGPAKAAVFASGLTGSVSGSSIANTVTTGTFTIPLMKRVGLPPHKAAAVEVAASTNGQLMPPVMGAAAFIMAEIVGLPYLDVLRAAIIPALVAYIALFYVVHVEACKENVAVVPRSELPPFWSTLLRGLHYLVPLLMLIWFLVIMRRSPVASALLAIQATVVIMLVQRPILAYLTHRRMGAGAPLYRVLGQALLGGVGDVLRGMIGGARNMVAVGVATATAGIIVGVVSTTGLVGRFVNVIEVLSMGSLYLMLGLTALTCIILGMGLPTTANYIVMATLTAPVIVQLGGDMGLLIPVIAAHLFVFYFGILADDTPPVGLAAYAGAAIAQSPPLKTGVQSFSYDLRTAILPFVFVFNTELLMISGLDEAGRIIWQTDPVVIGWTFLTALLGLFALVSAIAGYAGSRCHRLERLLLLALALLLLRPDWLAEPTAAPAALVQIACLAAYGMLYLWQRRRAPRPA